MKAFAIILSASALLSTFAYAEATNGTAVQAVQQERSEVQNEIQNRFKNMSTDELLEKRGTMTTQEEREALHKELVSRQATMTKEQKEKFMKRPENRMPKGMMQGQGQGMMQGQGGGMGGGMGRGGR